MGDEAYDEAELPAVSHCDDRTLVIRGGYQRDTVAIGICQSKDDEPDYIIEVSGADLKRALRSMVIGKQRARGRKSRT